MRIVMGIFLLAIAGCKPREPIPESCISEPARHERQYGCSGQFTYHFINDSTVVTVFIDREALFLSRECRTFNVTDDHISVQYNTASIHPDSVYFDYCTDVFFPEQGREISIPAVGGLLTVSVSNDFDQYIRGEYYSTNIKLTDLKFKQSDGTVINIPELVFYEVDVGWIPG